jgi:hypothetical protein
VITTVLPSCVALASCSALSSDHLPVLIDTGCRSTFHNRPEQSNVKHTYWANCHTQLVAQIPLIPKLHNGKDIVSCVEDLSGAILEALTACIPNRRPKIDMRPVIPAGIQDEIRLKIQLRRRWHVTRNPALKVEVNRHQRSVTARLNEWRNDQWSRTLECFFPKTNRFGG